MPAARKRSWIFDPDPGLDRFVRGLTFVSVSVVFLHVATEVGDGWSRHHNSEFWWNVALASTFALFWPIMVWSQLAYLRRGLAWMIPVLPLPVAIALCAHFQSGFLERTVGMVALPTFIVLASLRPRRALLSPDQSTSVNASETHSQQ